MNDSEQLSQSFCHGARNELAQAMTKIEHCLSQLTDEQVWWRPQAGMNSIANLMLHLSGNLRQWIVVRIGGGEDRRNRPAEFADRSNRPKAELLKILRDTVEQADGVLKNLSPSQLLESRSIQAFEGKVIDAILHCVPHFVGHSQEIIHLTREQLGERYQFNYVPKSFQQILAFGPAI